MTDIRGIYRQWLEILEGNGQGTSLCQLLLTPLLIQNVIDMHEMELVEARNTSNEKNVVLFLSIMPLKGKEGLTSLSKTLKQMNKENILKSLMQVSKGTNFEIKEETTKSQVVFDVPPLVKLWKTIDPESIIKWETKQHVGRYLEINCEYIARFWKSLLPKSEMSNGYIGVQLLTNTGNKTGIELVGYKDIFQSKGDKKKRHFKRIIIEADPGCGKSTYVNKLALDWATGDKYLRSIFDFVFLFELNRLTTVEDGFKCFLPKECHNFAAQQLNKVKNKVLIIFDGFDEMEQSGASFWYIQEILMKQKHCEATCIVTTRRSHINRIPPVAIEHRIVITGFSREAADKFMKKQECPLPSCNERKVIGDLLQIPLFCAIYCYMRLRLPQEELVSQYKLIESLVKSYTNLHGNKVAQMTDVVGRNYSLLDFESDTNAIGKFAMTQLDDISLKVIPTLKDIVFHTKVNYAELETVQLGLLIKKKCPTSEYLIFVDEYSFPHQMIAEYFAAQYVSNSISAAQIDMKSLLKYIKIPFVQFLLRIYFEKWSTTSIYDQYVQQFLKEPKIFGTWACSLPSVAKEQLAIVQINFSAEENNFAVVEDVPRDIFEVFVNEPVITKWKPEWWYQIESKMKAKKETIMVFGNIDASKGSRTTLNNYLESCSVWNLCGLSKNTNTFLNFCCESLTAVSIPAENISDQEQFYSDLVQCTNLRMLNLAHCHLNKEFVQNLLKAISLKKFVHLESLNLSDNDQVGQVTKLFDCLSKCRLKELKLKRCRLRHDVLNSFIDNVQNGCFQELETFNVSHNQIGRNKQFFTAVTQCKKMTNLNLSYCDITKESAEAFVKGAAPNFYNIEKLDLSFNQGIKYVEDFFTLLSTFHNLTSLKLQNCVGNKNLTSFVKQFSYEELPNLKILDVSYAKNLGHEVKFFSALILCKNLRTLNLCKTGLIQKSLEILVDGIKSDAFEHLESFDLGGNEHVGSYVALFSTLARCKNLRTLNLSCTGLIQTSLEILVEGIKTDAFEHLESFDLSANKHVGSCGTLFSVLARCKNLTTLNLCYTGLIQTSLEILVEGIKSDAFEHLESFDLGHSECVGSYGALFSVLAQCKNLTTLNLCNTGLIQTSLESLAEGIKSDAFEHLESFDLSYNKYVGSYGALFSVLARCKNLRTLNLYRTGLIQTSLESLAEGIKSDAFEHLESFDLSQNKHVGSYGALFSVLAQCKNLTTLNLCYTGLIQASLEILVEGIKSDAFEHLESFDLSENEHVGSYGALFSVLARCKNLKFLNLSRCKITAASLKELKIIPSLNEFNIAYNDEIGGEAVFFSSLIDYKSLSYINVYGCELTAQSLNYLHLLVQQGSIENHVIRIDRSRD